MLSADWVTPQSYRNAASWWQDAQNKSPSCVWCPGARLCSDRKTVASRGYRGGLGSWVKWELTLTGRMWRACSLVTAALITQLCMWFLPVNCTSIKLIFLFCCTWAKGLGWGQIASSSLPYWDSGQPSYEGDSGKKRGPGRPWLVGKVASWTVVLWPLGTGGDTMS